MKLFFYLTLALLSAFAYGQLNSKYFEVIKFKCDSLQVLSSSTKFKFSETDTKEHYQLALRIDIGEITHQTHENWEVELKNLTGEILIYEHVLNHSKDIIILPNTSGESKINPGSKFKIFGKLHPKLIKKNFNRLPAIIFKDKEGKSYKIVVNLYGKLG